MFSPWLIATIEFVLPIDPAWLVVGGLVALALFSLLRRAIGPAAIISRSWPLFVLRGLLIATALLILLNPSEVTKLPGAIDRPEMFFLLDASQSMDVGDKETRFVHAKRLIEEADQLADPRARADVRLFKFGHRLAALANEAAGKSKRVAQPTLGVASTAFAAESSSKPAHPAAQLEHLSPTDSDTQLLAALRQVSSRFGRRPPAGVVLFSDGRAHEEAGADLLGQQFKKLGIPVHAVPVGDLGRGGDVAIVACVVPPKVRRYSENEVQVFLRSYGFDGRRCELTLSTPTDKTSQDEVPLSAPVVVTLKDGFQSATLRFRSDSKSRQLRVRATTFPNEVSTDNNRFNADVAIDRTKIRVLYLEGSTQPLQPVTQSSRYEIRGPYTDLQKSLMEDEDIECVVLYAGGGRGRLMRVTDYGSPSQTRAFPETIAELSAFDAIILSDIAAEVLTDEQLAWIEQWVGQRGGGLLMVGGPHSFAAGGWSGTKLEQVLPIEMRSSGDWIPGTEVAIRPHDELTTHPVWNISTDARQNAKILERFPSFLGANRWASVKPNFTTVLALSNLTPATPPAVPAFEQGVPIIIEEQPETAFEAFSRSLFGGRRTNTPVSKPALNPEEGARLDKAVPNQPAFVAGRYGRGRTMALAVPITAPWANDFLANWNEGELRYSGKFWRNTVYWLTENSSIGRRRLIVSADKKFYRPGETIRLTAAAFDEATNQTGSYQISSIIEPQLSLNDLDTLESPIVWPDNLPRTSGETSPQVLWGEEFELPRNDRTAEKPGFSIDLPIADALSVGSASQSLRLELTAMQGATQIDSTSIDIQILHDPFEQQNPFPNHALLETIATSAGGQVIQSAEQLARVMENVPITEGPADVKQTPIWSDWWLWSWLLVLLTADWIYRRTIGLT